MPNDASSAKAVGLHARLAQTQVALRELEEENKQLTMRLERIELERGRLKECLARLGTLVSAVRTSVEDAGGRDLVAGMLAKGVPRSYRIRDMSMTLGQLSTVHEVLGWWDRRKT